MWNQGHAAQALAFGSEPSAFALQVVEQLRKGEKVLELGCGVGGDAILFAQHGAEVTATDFSDVVIAQNKEREAITGLNFEVLDIAQTFPYAAASFDVVYAHLSLHYFDAATTECILREIARVLKPGGRLYFACKSNHDILYGQGKQIEPDMFELNGHVRHFFSLEYTQQLLADNFEVLNIQEVSDVYSSKVSSFIRCWATKK